MSYTYRRNDFDTKYYSDLLKKNEKHNSMKIEVDPEPEIIEDNTNKTEDNSDPVSNKAKKSKQKKAEDTKAVVLVTDSFNKLFENLNTIHGLNVQLNFNSFSSTLETIIESEDDQPLELYLSEAYSKFRMSLYAMYLTAASSLSAQILDPAYILSDSMSYQDKFIILEKLYEYMKSLNEIYKDVKVSDIGLKLEKLSEKKEENRYNINTPEVRDFLSTLTATIKNISNKEIAKQESEKKKKEKKSRD